ncbi:LacI family DNA-binding transcriptional regulator [Pokkaliibacter sp. CJK22405]|uniref:LacI family DNA-binding transcriptional regulator n=1 Tax=Pokkaliibacter sp. CJK22405 TaxID=3384615 RepID=UPI00398496C0
MKLEEIARLAGVSKSTVSSVLNGKAEKYRISLETQERVRKIAAKYQYQPNFSAASLRRGISHSIGFVVPDFENRSYMRIAKRLEAVVRNAGYQLIISSSDDYPDTEREAAKLLAARGVDALLVSSCLDGDDPVYQQIRDRGIPVIAIDRPLAEHYSQVVSDDYQGGYELGRSLSVKNDSSVLLIGALSSLLVSQRRHQGFVDAMASMHIEDCTALHGDHFNASTGISLLKDYVAKRGSLPDAIVTTSYSLLEGVIETLMSWPEGKPLSAEGGIQLATFGNSRLLDFLPLAVNSLPQQYEQIAEAAWTLAKEAIDGTTTPRQVMISRKLTRRQHTA